MSELTPFQKLVGRAFFAVRDNGHGSPEARAAAREVVESVADRHGFARGRAEWNPRDDVWLAADVISHRRDVGGTVTVLIRLDENGQTMNVDARHLRGWSPTGGES